MASYTIYNTEINVSYPQATMQYDSILLIASGSGGMQPYYYEIGNEDGMLVYSINNSTNNPEYYLLKKILSTIFF